MGGRANAPHFSGASLPARSSDRELRLWEPASPEGPRGIRGRARGAASAGASLPPPPPPPGCPRVTGGRWRTSFLHFPQTCSLGRSVPAPGSARRSQSLTLGGEVHLLFFLFVNAAAAASQRRRFPKASLLPPAPSRAGAPPAPWSVRVWRRRNGCAARRARPSGSPCPAPPRAPPRRGPRCRRLARPRRPRALPLA